MRRRVVVAIIVIVIVIIVVNRGFGTSPSLVGLRRLGLQHLFEREWRGLQDRVDAVGGHTAAR